MASAPISIALKTAAVSVVKYGFPVLVVNIFIVSLYHYIVFNHIENNELENKINTCQKPKKHKEKHKEREKNEDANYTTILVLLLY